MRKFLSLFLVLFTLTFTSTCSAETLSDEILAQGKAEADLFLTLKQALGLDWIDEYNAYLGDPVTNPAPAWDTSVASLVSQGYLSSSFPTDFTIALTGQEVTISRTVSQAALREAMAIYLPAMTVSGDVVSLLVQRPAQWIAYETALNGKVSRDGSDNPDILPNSSLDFGSNSQINFVSGDGKILGVNSLFYKTQELDNRFVNITGDTMTGVLTATGFKVGSNNVWHAGNDGTGSGLDADLLDGQHGAFYQNASNLSTGVVPVARLSGTYGIDITGNASTATNANHANNADYATNAGNADTLDGKHESAFAPASHNHGQYVLKAGDTMTGALTAPEYRINDANTKLLEGANNSVRVQTNYGYTEIGPQNTSHAHFITDMASFYFNKPVLAESKLQVYNTNTYLTGTEGKIAGNTVWHAGNDGSGSGLDADTLDGKHLSEIGGSGLIPNGIKLYMTAGTYTWTKNPGTRYVFVKLSGAGGGVSTGTDGGTSQFGDYVYAYGGKGATSGNNSSFGAGGSASGGDINISGQKGSRGAGGSPGSPPGSGGGAFNAGEYKDYGPSGEIRTTENFKPPTVGGGSASYSTSANGLVFYYKSGGGGGYAEKWIDVSSVSSLTVIVGAGGGSGIYKGADGAVMVYEFK